MSTTKTPAPSAIARHVANAMWPQVQASYKLARGIYWFTCAGHGGAVAIIGEADLPTANVDAARMVGRIELVVLTGWKGKPFYSTAQHYTRESLEEWAAKHGYATLEAWVGEEDCDWAQIAHCSPAMRDAMHTKLGCSPVSEDDVFQNLRRWNERYLIALDPEGYEIDPNGDVMQEIIERRLLNAGKTLRCSAVGVNDRGIMLTGGEPTKVHVLFRGKGDFMEGYYMSQDTYREIPLGTTATPDDFRQFGELTPAPPSYQHDDPHRLPDTEES